jgi:hypothetical protein
MLKQLLSVLGLSALLESALPDGSEAAAAAVATRAVPPLNLLGRSAVFGAQRNSWRGDPGGVHAKLTYRGGTHARNRGPAGHAGTRAYNEYHSAPLDRMTDEYLTAAKENPDGATAMYADYLCDAAEQRNAAKARRRAIRKAGGQA